MNSAYLFPGQGSFLPHALKNLAGASKEASAVLDALDSGASHFYKERPAKRILDGSLEISANVSVSDFEAIQLAIFATPLAVFRILQGNGAPPPELLIGHSFGEIPALVAAGAFTVEEGAAIVCARNTALRKAGIAGGMLALATDTGTAGALVAFLDDPFLTVAVHNSPRQTVLSGSEEAIAKAAAVARTAQLTSARLPSPYPFHHPALTTASREFRRSIDSIRPRALTIPVYSPILRKFYSAEDDLLTCLAEHLVRPVQFTEAIRDLHARGTDRFVECGAQSTLTSLVKRTVPDVTTIICLDNRTATSDFLQRAVDTLAGQPISSESTQVPADPSPPPLHTQQKEQFTAMNTSSPDRDEVLAALKALYAQALEYPEEVFSPDVELEA
ncbi:ACP S-malonyltransferase, partial [Streptomyces virginiae]|uniref:ACP S-malonyltransferase n=2 Tax=Streptomyces TaxID=1883 RepID=UPI000AC39BA5